MNVLHPLRPLALATPAAGCAAPALTQDEHSSAYKQFGGYPLTRYLGMELGHFRLGRFGLHGDTAAGGVLDDGFRVQGFNAERVSATGLGASQSVTAAGECEGPVASAELLRCLRPDRRVEISMTGTR